MITPEENLQKFRNIENYFLQKLRQGSIDSHDQAIRDGVDVILEQIREHLGALDNRLVPTMREQRYPGVDEFDFHYIMDR